jgi:UDP-N-acetylglucosamine 2-epimerase (non-hydrolysing)
MPEELNRILTDNLSRILLAPTEGARRILLGEGFPAEWIFVTGNTVVDAVNAISGLGEQTGWAGENWDLRRGKYYLLTLHRPENVDDPDVLAGLLHAVDKAARRAGVTAVFPVHPRTRARMENYRLSPGKHILPVEPVDYVKFVSLQRHARLVITDSGGVQEEACVLGVPCVTTRLATERPETVEVGANVVTGVKPDEVIAGIVQMDGKPAAWKNPFGDGSAGERIVEVVLEELAD